ncbi:MAG: LLM class flavin-dependent oxidoreductase [Nitrospinota bacterium]
MNPPVEAGLILALTTRGLAIRSYESMRDVAREAEGAGFHSLWLCDHFFTLPSGSKRREQIREIPSRAEAARESASPPTQPLLEVWTTLSALSRDTERIRLGPCVLAVGYRNPALLAKMAATLDVISGGRLEMGIGAGWIEAEYKAYGYEFPRPPARIAQMEEAVQIMKRMWTEPEPTFTGAHYRIERAYCDPLPLQKPHPPIWIGGEGPKVLGVAARHADGFNARYWPPERFAERAGELAAACREAGRDPAALRSSVMLLLIPERDPAQAEAERRNFPATPDSGVVAGRPEACIERLRAYLRAGVRRILVSIPNLDKRPERLRLAGDEILPALLEGGG